MSEGQPAEEAPTMEQIHCEHDWLERTFDTVCVICQRRKPAEGAPQAADGQVGEETHCTYCGALLLEDGSCANGPGFPNEPHSAPPPPETPGPQPAADTEEG